MIEAFESPPSFKWGLKRRRSALDEGAPSSRAPSPSTYDEIEHRKPRIKTAGAASASPVTPLSFSPSESDEKSRHALKKCSKIRPREEYIDMIEELTQRRDLLKGEIANVTKYYNKLNAYNSQLKSMKQEVLNSCHKKEKPELAITAGMNIGGELTHNHQKCVVAHQQPLIVDQMAETFQYSIGPLTAQFYSSNNGLGPVNDVGPLGIPDLNLSAEEVFVVDASQPLDMSRVLADRRARFAEARRRRKGIIKIKSMRSACGIKLPGHR
ncbi:hypothetical protein BUALT_Bualt08G0084200 [Buddleja alternifolia]|uniref:Uncharacterized protein n=1 Tax=Buddleja alternifolia TaxID=168488 RepID=A0AAV6XFT3_9LAMI|nr:hypothetical protein BUALT_Bualt08G0084200 [Buddleja alternifolia]